MLKRNMMLNFAIPCSGRNQNGIIKTGLASEYQQQQSASGRDLQGYCRDHQTDISGVSGMRPYASRIMCFMRYSSALHVRNADAV